MPPSNAAPISPLLPLSVTGKGRLTVWGIWPRGSFDRIWYFSWGCLTGVAKNRGASDQGGAIDWGRLTWIQIKQIKKQRYWVECFCLILSLNRIWKPPYMCQLIYGHKGKWLTWQKQCRRQTVQERTCMAYYWHAAPWCDSQATVVCWTLPYILALDTLRCTHESEASCVPWDCKLSRTFYHTHRCHTTHA